MDNGWIKLHRKTLNWEWYSCHNTSRVFFHCLLLANHKDKKWRGIVVEKGSFITSIGNLAKGVGLSLQQIRTALNKLKSTNNLTIKPTNKYTMISVVKWDIYNGIDENITNNPTNNPTIKQQTNNKQITTNKNDNNVKNEKNKKKDFYFSLGFSDTLTELIIEYDKIRKVKLNKLTKKGLELWKKNLKTYGDGIEEQMAFVLERSIANGWQGIFADNKSTSQKKDRRENPNNLTDIELGQLWFNARNGNKATIEYIKNHGLKDKIGEDKFKEYEKLYINNLLQGTKKTS